MKKMSVMSPVAPVSSAAKGAFNATSCSHQPITVQVEQFALRPMRWPEGHDGEMLSHCFWIVIFKIQLFTFTNVAGD
jgi:hypothetical protein